MTLYATLALIAMGLTVGGMAVQQNFIMMIAAIFWFLSAGFAYTQSTAAWDIYYLIFFASMFIGVVVLSAGLYQWRRGKAVITDETDDYDDNDMASYEKDVASERKAVRRVRRLGKRKKKPYFNF